MLKDEHEQKQLWSLLNKVHKLTRISDENSQRCQEASRTMREGCVDEIQQYIKKMREFLQKLMSKRTWRR